MKIRLGDIGRNVMTFGIVALICVTIAYVLTEMPVDDYKFLISLIISFVGGYFVGKSS